MLRKRKNRRYNETNDEDGERRFNLQEQIKSKRFDQIREKHLQELPGEAITLKLIQRHGFEKPILVTKPDGLDLRVPPKSFLVRDIRNYVGHERIIDVMDVKTQKNIEMSMKDWCKYYESKNRDRLLNVISLEFSHTKLDELVDSPMIVKLLDWVDLVWPKFLKLSQTESTNTINKMKYPKVQKYCLMSVKGSYTDFHIDFGGTSVWYHILRGKKIFWMVPPTELNLQTFEEWTLSGMQQNVFFGDTVEECFRVELSAGNTFFIPSGWIHAVYTLEDSLVFGGNFLHSFGIENQLKVSKIEDATKVPLKFRYPFYTEILWYVVQHYVYCLANKDHLHRPDYEAAEAQMALEISQAAQNKIENSIKEIEDETTESEHEESDTTNIAKGKKRPKATTKRKQPPRRQKPAPKKTKKPPPPSSSEDDESTDIDSANEESSKLPEKSTINTCRMTKNSLLRLQYEVDERQQAAATTPTTSKSKSDQSNSGSKNSSSKKKTSTSSPSPKNHSKSNPTSTMSTTTQNTPSNSNTLNLADIVLSHENKLNGWSSAAGATSGQTIWSNPNASSIESTKIHITRFEVTGLKLLVKHLSKLSGAKKNLPNLIRNSRALLDDCKKLIAEHENDDPELAITGKPITQELLRPKKTDMNELIGQFFKNSEEATTEINHEQLPCSSPVKSSSAAQRQIKSDPNITTTATLNSPSQLKSKNNNHNSNTQTHLKSDEKKNSNNIAALNSSVNESVINKSSSPHKETKCLSPNKKLSSAIGTTNTSSPPPRPKSPPTRPLSMNQYTSKTKNENNLLLPGSFADLIAATSTEKKVFDVSGADVASTLFGTKDLASSSTKSHSSSNKATTQKDRSRQRSVSSSSSGSGTNIKMTGISTTVPVAPSASGRTSTSHDNLAANIATSNGASARIGKEAQQPHYHYNPNKPNSPEPPKVSPNFQKRFVAPNTKPQSKEKLIYASAPYISPVHASEASRSTQYPWQTPLQQATYPPRTPHPAQLSQLSSSSSATTPISAGDMMIGNPAPFTSETRRTVSPSHPVHLEQNRDQMIKKQQQASQLPFDKMEQQSNGQKGASKERTQINVIVNQSLQEQQNSNPPGNVNKESRVIETSLPPNLVQSSTVSRSAVKDTVKKETAGLTTTEPKTVNAVLDNKQASTGNSSEQVAKKPTKPRGPPKKSKEARQVINESTEPIIPPAIPASVIRAGPSLSSSSVVEPAAQPQTKPKVKRPKKQKDVESNHSVSIASSFTTSSPVQSQLNAMTPNQVRPSLIYGVRPIATQSQLMPQHQLPPAATAGSKINPQSYIISRPLFSFNSMPTFSPAHFQHLQQQQQHQQQQRPMNLLAAPMSTPLGLPALQQGARIVWATQPRKMSPIGTTNPSPVTPLLRPSNSKDGAPSVPMNPQLDNAALLSLATTALSTAPLTSSPASSHFSHRAPAPQAIMMSTAATTIANQQQALFAAAGQQFMRPFMPMTHLISRPSAPRPAGQLVFARLPSSQSQSQPRYLITQPGFMPQRFHTPQIVTSQPTPTLAFATYKPQPEPTKALKTKKVKTS